ncbi:MAG: FHA domain-containing protein [Planctomycetaceae bacterium]|nr:FHA domain-containing protein [Planctomycetales bacterium]MCB9874708.1 FHA domain-containing protein [Planctomycetaceae bacterium]MCB9938372.1 FHA domain-containing protein [Planctomycetaceae bacterium]
MASSVFDVGGGNQQVRFTPEMLQMLFAQRESRDDREAYLLVRDGRSWGDMHRLRPGASIPVGRVAADGIVVRDDRCSRIHCEFYLQDQDWYVRDRGSRNGTRLNGETIQVATKVKNGDIIRIGHTKMMFTRDLASAMNTADTDDDSSSGE